MAIEGNLVPRRYIVQHVILMEEVANERVSDVIVLFELCDQVCVLLTSYHILDSLG